MIYKKVASWGFGNDSTFMIEDLINKGETDFIVIGSDPGQEMDRSYEVVIPFYTKRWRDLGIEVHIIKLPYDIYTYFYDIEQVPLGWLNPKCSSHFKRDFIRSWYRNAWGVVNKNDDKILYGRNISIIEMIGHSLEEKGRVKYPTSPQWLVRKYPNYDNKVTKPMIKKYFADNNIPEPMKSACWFCPNKPVSAFAKIKNEFPLKFKMLVKLENHAKGVDGRPAPTLKEKGPIDELVEAYEIKKAKEGKQTKLDDFFDLDESELNCSSYCYT